MQLRLRVPSGWVSQPEQSLLVAYSGALVTGSLAGGWSNTDGSLADGVQLTPLPLYSKEPTSWSGGPKSRLELKSPKVWEYWQPALQTVTGGSVEGLPSLPRLAKRNSW